MYSTSTDSESAAVNTAQVFFQRCRSTPQEIKCVGLKITDIRILLKLRMTAKLALLSKAIRYMNPQNHISHLAIRHFMKVQIHDAFPNSHFCNLILQSGML